MAFKNGRRVCLRPASGLFSTLLLSRSAPGNGSSIATEYRNAAELAIETSGLQSMELVVKDTGGAAAGAIARSEEAVREGAAVILGPVFSGSVTSAASVARPASRSIIAFSSDPAAASNGVFLMSFLPTRWSTGRSPTPPASA